MARIELLLQVLIATLALSCVHASSFGGLEVLLFTPGRTMSATASDVVQYPCTDAGNDVFQCRDVVASCGDRFLFADTVASNRYHRIFAQPTGEYSGSDSSPNDRMYDTFKFTQGPGTYFLEMNVNTFTLTNITLTAVDSRPDVMINGLATKWGSCFIRGDGFSGMQATSTYQMALTAPYTWTLQTSYRDASHPDFKFSSTASSWTGYQWFLYGDSENQQYSYQSLENIQNSQQHVFEFNDRTCDWTIRDGFTANSYKTNFGLMAIRGSFAYNGQSDSWTTGPMMTLVADHQWQIRLSLTAGTIFKFTPRASDWFQTVPSLKFGVQGRYAEGNWNINQNGDYVITFNELTEQATIAPYVAPSSSSTGVSSPSSSSSTGPSVVSSFQGLKVVLWTPGRKLLSTASDVVQYPCTDAGNGVFQCADVSASCGDRFLFADTASNNAYHRIYDQPTGEYTATEANYNDRVYDSFKFTQGPGTYYLEVDAIKMNITKIVLTSADSRPDLTVNGLATKWGSCWLRGDGFGGWSSSTYQMKLTAPYTWTLQTSYQDSTHPDFKFASTSSGWDAWQYFLYDDSENQQYSYQTLANIQNGKQHVFEFNDRTCDWTIRDGFTLNTFKTNFGLMAIRGSFPYNGATDSWTTGPMMTLVANNQWQITLTLPAGTSFKFIPKATDWFQAVPSLKFGVQGRYAEGNWKLDKAGNYTITFNELTEKVTIVAAKNVPVTSTTCDTCIGAVSPAPSGLNIQVWYYLAPYPNNAYKKSCTLSGNSYICSVYNIAPGQGFWFEENSGSLRKWGQGGQTQYPDPFKFSQFHDPSKYADYVGNSDVYLDLATGKVSIVRKTVTVRADNALKTYNGAPVNMKWPSSYLRGNQWNEWASLPATAQPMRIASANVWAATFKAQATKSGGNWKLAQRTNYNYEFPCCGLNMPPYANMGVNGVNVTFFFNDFTYEFAIKPKFTQTAGYTTRWPTIYMRSDLLTKSDSSLGWDKGKVMSCTGDYTWQMSVTSTKVGQEFFLAVFQTGVAVRWGHYGFNSTTNFKIPYAGPVLISFNDDTNIVTYTCTGTCTGTPASLTEGSIGINALMQDSQTTASNGIAPSVPSGDFSIATSTSEQSDLPTDSSDSSSTGWAVGAGVGVVAIACVAAAVVFKVNKRRRAVQNSLTKQAAAVQTEGQRVPS